MTYVRKLIVLTAATLCLAIAAPACAAPKKDAPAQRSEHTKISTKKNARSHKTGKTDPARGNDNRALWLRRAGKSEMLTGKASWYGGTAHGGETASGLLYDMYTFTAAHRILPIGTVVKVTDQENGKSVIVCITDRGPYARGRVIDLSWAAAKQIDLDDRGVGPVDLNVVSDENGTPLKPDEAFYVRYAGAAKNAETVGPFRVFADAAVIHEALSNAHPDAEVVIAQK
ncbi:MAG: rare lipoprotein A [Candidatus Desulfovibrio kirbyi]|uniref:Probable endolytic peptidoglycan transglycosylase RlpA n=1 Tax=Candidatus Desulfovibrio kirbyi TaxID=2696086 RepID=A0A6L2R471_9BACT|nr:MAG: rare lipoprotein A [Candidatus Desulfovibrio kirbyi]